MFPRGSPNIQGIRHHLACKSLFLSLTLYILLFPSSLCLFLSLLLSTGHTFSLVGFPLIFNLNGLTHSLSKTLSSQDILLIGFWSFSVLLDSGDALRNTTRPQPVINFVIDKESVVKNIPIFFPFISLSSEVSDGLSWPQTCLWYWVSSVLTL